MAIETSQIAISATGRSQPHHSDEFLRSTEYAQRFRSQAEKENLLNNLVALRRTLWEMRAKTCQLEKVVEETKHIQAEVELLRAQINAMAAKLELQPMLGNRNGGIKREARE